MEGGTFKLRLLNPGYGTLKNVWPIVIKTKHETAVHLDAVIVQYPSSAQVILRRRCLFTGLQKIVVAEGFVADKNTGAARQCHLAHQRRVVGHVDGSGATAGLSYDINDNLTAGVKVTYDDAFETRVMATINYTFANLIKGGEEEKKATTNMVMNALSDSPEQRDIRVHDCGFRYWLDVWGYIHC